MSRSGDRPRKEAEASRGLQPESEQAVTRAIGPDLVRVQHFTRQNRESVRLAMSAITRLGQMSFF